MSNSRLFHVDNSAIRFAVEGRSAFDRASAVVDALRAAGIEWRVDGLLSVEDDVIVCIPLSTQD